MSFWSDIGDVGNRIVTTSQAVLDEAQKSIALQAVGAVATGGLSLVAQAAVAGVTGQANPFTQSIADAAKDPLKTVGAIPGVVLGELGGVGLVATAGKLGAAAVGGITDNQTIKDVGKGIGAAQGVLRDHPEIAGGILVGAAGLAVGIPGAGGALTAGLSGLAGATAGKIAASSSAANPGAARGAEYLSRFGTRPQIQGEATPAITGHILTQAERVRADALRTQIPFLGAGDSGRAYWPFFGRRNP